jgi:hypothetical protein
MSGTGGAIGGKFGTGACAPGMLGFPDSVPVGSAQAQSNAANIIGRYP